MITFGIILIFAGAASIALASLCDSAMRLPGVLRELERDTETLRQIEQRATPYTGPIFNRHGREIERN